MKILLSFAYNFYFFFLMTRAVEDCGGGTASVEEQ